MGLEKAIIDLLCHDEVNSYDATKETRTGLSGR